MYNIKMMKRALSYTNINFRFFYRFLYRFFYRFVIKIVGEELYDIGIL